MHIFRKRQGQADINNCYFYTDTIYQFRHLLADDHLKEVVIASLRYLVEKRLVTIYGFVIMPNHIHLLWFMHSNNGKESAAVSFAKFTAHMFKKHLQQTGELHVYKSDKQDRQYQFWKRDPLAICVSTEKIFISKLEYIHNNPVKEKWSLCKYAEDYKWSSAKFYITGEDEFKILTHYKE
ncbi:MAG: transposase [Parafilimonas sp.]